ncbi:MAG TPA: TPM domain-containing protein [Bacteroidia bacterium]
MTSALGINRKYSLKLHHSLWMLLMLLTNALLAGIPPKPNPPRLVNNFSRTQPNFINKQEEKVLEDKLEEFARSTSNQIVIVIVDDLDGMDANQYATELGHQWKIGQEKKDNGIVILISLGIESGRRQEYVAVGYGLEGAIPDLATKQIRERHLRPNLKSGDYFRALNETTNALMALAKGEYNDKVDVKKKSSWKTILGILVIILIIFLISRRNNRGGGLTIGPGSTIFWGGSNWGGGGSSWGGGDSGGGGFGGFGGGDFGGGGSGGDW